MRCFVMFVTAVCVLFLWFPVSDVSQVVQRDKPHPVPRDTHRHQFHSFELEGTTTEENKRSCTS